MQSTALQDKIQVGSENQDLTSSDVGSNNDTMEIEQKISDLSVRYKQNKQKLEQENSVYQDVVKVDLRKLSCWTAKPCQ